MGDKGWVLTVEAVRDGVVATLGGLAARGALVGSIGVLLKAGSSWLRGKAGAWWGEDGVLPSPVSLVECEPGIKLYHQKHDGYLNPQTLPLKHP